MNICSVIVHFNTPLDVAFLVRQLVEFKSYNHKVIVVDNCSSGQNYNELSLELRGLPNVILIQADRNGGFGYGVNRAFDYLLETEKEFLLHVINSDSKIVNKIYLGHLAEYLIRNENVGIIGPTVLENDDGLIQNTIMPFNSIRSIIGFKKQYSEVNLSEYYKEPVNVDCINGVCFMIKSSVFKLVGCFNEAFFMYNEEQDLCFRVKAHGYENIYFPILSILHEGAKSTFVEYLDWRFVLKRRNQVLFILLHRRKLEAVLVAGLFLVSGTIKFIKTSSRNKSVSYKYFLTQITSTFKHELHR